MKSVEVILVAVFTSMLTTVGVMYGAQRLGYLPGGDADAKHDVAPDLMGLNEADARANLTALGLKLVVSGREAHEEAEEGTVIGQVPKPGESLPAGGAVNVTFALAPPKVPDVVGKKVEEATKVLEGAGYVVTVGDPEPSEKQAEGAVASTDPKAGTALRVKGTVTLHTAAPAGPVEIPQLVGLGVEAAKKAGEEAKLKVRVQYVSLAETQTGVVLSQQPRAGDKIEPDSEVVVTINH
jgi:eukaryotic-like serine/threonine-protein kinase